jgi:hypothetical protein
MLQNQGTGTLTIGPTEAPTAPPSIAEITDPARNRILSGLHVLFNNHKFQEFVGRLCQEEIRDPTLCKQKFKKYMKVGSCTELSIEQINDFREKFNQSLKETQ